MNVLGIFSHPDDEIACIGTLANHSDAGDTITLLFLTKGEATTKLAGTRLEIKEQRVNQARKAGATIGAQVEFLDIPDTQIRPSRKFANLIADKIKEVQPDIILTWNKPVRTGTGHPDHRYTHDLVVDSITYARFGKSKDQPVPHRKRISLYTIQHYETSPKDLVFVDVSHQYDRIMEYLEPYLVTFGEWDVKAHKTAILRYFGNYIRADYAEGFQKLTWRKGRSLLD